MKKVKKLNIPENQALPMINIFPGVYAEVNKKNGISRNELHLHEFM